MATTSKTAAGALHPYPTLRAKLWRLIQDVPWQLSRFRMSAFRAEFEELYRLVAPYTMLEYRRLEGLYRGIHHIVRTNTPGAVVECGTARGGSAALMGLALKRLQSDRALWLFDTFAGLPAPTAADPDYELVKRFTGTCVGELAEVRDLFLRFGILDNARMIKGLFQDTLEASGVEAIAFLHIDGDWHDSVRTCLESLYRRVSPGGIIQVDDYGQWAGARKAVHAFLRDHAPGARLRYLDYSGRQIIKPGNRSSSCPG